VIHDVLVMVPTYDEADNVESVLASLFAAMPDAHVLVVDDNSPDGTGDLVAARADHGTRVFLLRRPGKAGLGAAHRAGFAWALNHSYDAVVQMDADLSHRPMCRVLAGESLRAAGARPPGA
jgi:dolichol-phosphate mannosyltransferase